MHDTQKFTVTLDRATWEKVLEAIAEGIDACTHELAKAHDIDSEAEWLASRESHETGETALFEALRAKGFLKYSGYGKRDAEAPTDQSGFPTRQEP